MVATGESTSDCATEAAKRALEDAHLKPEDLDFIICATNSPDRLFPATATLIMDKLGIKKVGGFDLQAGCTSFVYGIDIADKFVRSGQYKHVMVVGAEALSRIVDWQDRATCVLFADGAGATIISQVEDPSSTSEILSSFLGSDPSHAYDIYLEGPLGAPIDDHDLRDNKTHYIRMNGQDVFKFAVRIMKTCVDKVLSFSNHTIKQVDSIIPHQANYRILESAARLLRFPYEKVYVNIEKYGNTSAATIPIALADAKEQGFLKQGDLTILVGFGAGLTYGANLLRW